ncbi:hypothetical protein SASPL_121433 [Salvia splendens]|uniref:EF-hand domain-containing protein n=1 Tax=Salvia splendens TaxID=180675 RepID=A0A8X8ZW33_SALSN|nr:hypothetical protein SASPL_121433 [Salvia splendens]
MPHQFRLGVVCSLFNQIDKDRSTSVSAAELRVLLLGVRLDEDDLSTDRDVENVLESFDTTGDGRINQEEFIAGMTKLLDDLAEERRNRIKGSRATNSQASDPSQQGLLVNSNTSNVSKSQSSQTTWLNYLQALSLVILGIALMSAFAEPLITSVVGFATAAYLPNFSVSYLAIPLATNYRVAVQAFASSGNKSQNSISLTLSTLYSSVYMNNVASLIVFLAPVNALNLSVDVFAEVLVVITMNTVMTALTGFRTSFPSCWVMMALERLKTFYIHEIQSGKVEVEKGYAISEMLKTFDLSRDGRIEEDEFVEGCSKWINEAAELAGKGDSDAAEFLREASVLLNQFAGREDLKKAEIEHLMARILKHAHSEELEAEQLVTDDGKPNIERIKALFKQFDTDRSSSLSRPELEQLIHTTVTKTGDSQLRHEEMVKKFVEDFDTDGIMWGEVDNLVYEVGRNEDSHLKLLTWSSTKSIFQVMLGIAILTFLSGPLKTSIQHFSHAIGVPAFFVSFVVVPICLNALSAISAIFPASQKSSRTSSLTFSEIYGGVVMNNIMGLSTLLAIVYIKGLEWDYSAEVLTVCWCAQ